jgi:uncharacterized membrane protein YkoI
MTRLLPISVLLSCAALALAQPVAAQGRDARPSLGAAAADQDEARGGHKTPLVRVLAMIGQRTPGRHLNTTEGDVGGRAAYLVQWQLPDGRVMIFVVDAETGQILSRQGG